jgi:hypothetical protein
MQENNRADDFKQLDTEQKSVRVMKLLARLLARHWWKSKQAAAGYDDKSEKSLDLSKPRR